LPVQWIHWCEVKLFITCLYNVSMVRGKIVDNLPV
jgi:hypothetical protein